MVEDHVINQIATRKVLTSWSDFLTVDIAADGEEAVDKFHKKEYDLVLMDLQMPVMGGLEATERIRDELNLKELPIIAMTANAMTGDKEKCLIAGMNDYTTKPINPKKLIRTLSHWIQ